jgi:hypothetical protein
MCCLRLQTPEGLAPIGAALVADAVLRSVPGVGAIVALLTGAELHDKRRQMKQAGVHIQQVDSCIRRYPC